MNFFILIIIKMSFVSSVIGNLATRQFDMKEFWQKKLSHHMIGKCSGSIIYSCPEDELFAVEWLKRQTGMTVSLSYGLRKFLIKWDYHKDKNEIKVNSADTKGKYCSSCGGVFKKAEGFGWK